MAAPKVQTIAEAMADLNPAYASSKNLVSQKQAALPGKYDAQRAAITAEKGEGFNAINNQATGRGASFSGIPLDEQARYLSTKFLPGMQQADYQQNEEDLALQGQIAGIDKEIATNAIGRVDKQTSDLNSWNQTLQQQQFTAAEAAKDRALTASQGAANRAASASSQAVPIYDQLALRFEQMSNEYGDVSPSQWKILRKQAEAGGMDTATFSDMFWNYADDKSWKDYLS